MTDMEILKEIRSAFEREPRIHTPESYPHGLQGRRIGHRRRSG